MDEPRMTVRDLINKLQEMDPNAVVVLHNHEYMNHYPISSIKGPSDPIDVMSDPIEGKLNGPGPFVRIY